MVSRSIELGDVMQLSDRVSPTGTSRTRLRGSGLDELGRYLRLILTPLAGTTFQVNTAFCRILASEVRSLTQLPCAGSALAKAAAIRSR